MVLSRSRGAAALCKGKSEMKELKKFILSEQGLKEITGVLNRTVNDLKSEMEIQQIDHLKVSIDLNFTMPGPFAGVKVSGWKHQEMQFFLDKEMDVNK